mgnify:CR=1 FL=1
MQEKNASTPSTLELSHTQQGPTPPHGAVLQGCAEQNVRNVPKENVRTVAGCMDQIITMPPSPLTSASARL